MPMSDERDLGQLLAEFSRRQPQAKTDVERKRLEKELDEHIARPELITGPDMTSTVETLAREFEIRLKRASSPPPDLTPEYREAFGPFFERMGTVPPPDQWKWFPFDLWTPHMVRFCFVYGVEPLRALLARKAFWMIAPSIEYFEAARADDDDIERARKTRAFVDAVVMDIDAITDVAIGRFAEALSCRLSTVLDDALSEIALRAMDELKGSL